MVPVYRYAVSYAHGRDEAWVARFLDELRGRLETPDGPRFHRLVPPALPPAGREGSYGVETADIVLALCSPAYFNEGPAQHDWAVLALRRSLGQARTGVAPQTALPLVWEPVDRRLPGPVATADALAADQPPEYRSQGLALMTMQAPRYRAALDRVLDAIVARMTAMAQAAAPAPELDDRFAGEAPDALSAEDAAFTEQFRKEVAPVLPALPVARTLDVRAVPDGGADGGTDGGASPVESVLAAELMPELGRRLLLVGPPGSGHSTELARLAGRALDDRVPGRTGSGLLPWGCRIPFVLSARSGALPRLDGMVPTLAPLAAPHEPAGWAARQLRSGRAFLAVDDLDAVPAGNRAAVWEWLLRLLRAHPQAPCVIVTNGTGVPWARLGDDFRVAGLAPLPPDGVRTLLGSLVTRSPGDRRALTALLRRFDTEPDPLLLGVAGRPAAAAALLRAASGQGRQGGPGGSGPVPRHRLLRAGVSALWRRAREEAAGPSSPPVAVPGPAADQVPDSVLRAASGRLAVATLGLDSSRIPLRTALGALREPGVSDAASSERLLAALADRAGVVFRPGPDTVAFPGREVRTFLAAHHLAHAPGADTDELLGRHPSAELTELTELGELLAQLRTAEAGTGTPRSVLATPGGPPRRLSAGSTPPRPAVRRAGARSRAELRALLRAGTAVAELRCTGPVDGLAESLPRLPGLRSLVLADDPSLAALPELSGCRSLRSLRVLRCPNLRDLTALESSAVMFLDIDPWPDLPLPAGLRRAPWLSGVDLVTGGAGGRSARAGGAGGAGGVVGAVRTVGRPGTGVAEPSGNPAELDEVSEVSEVSDVSELSELPEVRIRLRLRG